MLKFIRYAIAALFFAVSVGCLALWWRSMSTRNMFDGSSFLNPRKAIGFGAGQGIVTVNFGDAAAATADPWSYTTMIVSEPEREFKERFVAERGRFTAMSYGGGTAIYFPLWYPALVFAIAGVGALRFRRQFSIRSAIIVTSVVAALIGMAVIL